jgi:hypothetical protein
MQFSRFMYFMCLIFNLLIFLKLFKTFHRPNIAFQLAFFTSFLWFHSNSVLNHSKYITNQSDVYFAEIPHFSFCNEQHLSNRKNSLTSEWTPARGKHSSPQTFATRLAPNDSPGAKFIVTCGRQLFHHFSCLVLS